MSQEHAAGEHAGEYVPIESYSGQDDLAFIRCSCGWETWRIWSRLELEGIRRAFALHCQQVDVEVDGADDGTEPGAGASE